MIWLFRIKLFVWTNPNDAPFSESSSLKYQSSAFGLNFFAHTRIKRYEKSTSKKNIKATKILRFRFRSSWKWWWWWSFVGIKIFLSSIFQCFSDDLLNETKAEIFFIEVWFNSKWIRLSYQFHYFVISEVIKPISYHEVGMVK